ncbi:MAG: cobalt-precorrin-5B (C(1))-methyltransferase [Leptolyngbyaceae cyanobacterium T60_A2020_046]|nr:cobalt-precorrin-5B (C(1))-methyltransferase [Leptolyngbyaceae cyanobacterium T60_A2020_046]
MPEAQTSPTDPQCPTAAPRAGFTLPVFACASAIAALDYLQQGEARSRVSLDLIEPARTVTVPIEQVAPLPDGSVLAITRSDPGDNLDLTRDTPVWAVVAWAGAEQSESIEILGGEGIGRQTAAGDRPAIYRYARQILQTNLATRLTPGQKIRVTVILPEGRSLALRTSNAAFGVVEGLSLLGTAGIAQPLSAPSQLDKFRQALRSQAARHRSLVFCLGENGLDLALKLGIEGDRRVKTANWLGPMLVEAGMCGVESILLLGYHGKLIKLAGGIFHTHHHVADGRQEILSAIAAAEGLPTPSVQTLLNAPTVEAGLTHLRRLDAQGGTTWVSRIYRTLAERVDQRAMDYIRTHSDRSVTVGTVLFDRQRQVIQASERGHSLLP